MAHPTIETERLILRPMESSDVLRYATLLSNPRISENTARIPWPYHPDDAASFAMLAAERDRRNPFFVITCKSLGPAAQGGIGIEASHQPQQAEIGYWLAAELWGQGLGHEAAHATCNHAFSEIGYDVLLARYRHGNEGSRRILDRLGFRVTGHRTGYSLATGLSHPIAMLEVTRNEWFSNRSLRIRGSRIS
jgi:RimJ/RimL family protein N-acetyltransferase